MKKLIILGLALLSLTYCKKKEPTVTEPTKAVTPLSVLDKTVSISCQTACGGILRVVWNYDYNEPSTDSIYNYTPTTIFTKVVPGDSIRVYWYSSICTSCSPCASQISISVNGIVKQSWSNDMGANYKLIAL